MSNGASFSTDFQSRNECSGGQGSAGQYVSTIFLVTKKDGGMRPVINLPESIKYLNHLVRNKHFQMEGLGSLLNYLVGNEFLTKLDLQDTYFTLPIHQKDLKYLCFRWRGKLFQFQVLPFRSPGIHSGDEGANDLLATPCIQECSIPGRHLSGEPSGSSSSKNPGNGMARRAPRVHHKL